MAQLAALHPESDLRDTASQQRLPDFIIGGAPKCGTTSLHFILDQHPDIGIPDEEVHYFDADDPITHPDFLYEEKGSLKWWDPRPPARDNLNWYADRFAALGNPQFLGEDSTTYLMSEVAAARINALLPEAKVIFMLRHPVERAYSQYWHLMKTSRATDTFETALTKHPHILLGSSFCSGIRRFQQVLGEERVKVCLFEDFRTDMQGCVDSVTDFIGAPRMTVDPKRSWFNRTMYPSNIGLQRQANRIGRHLVKGRYHRHMGGERGLQRRVEDKLHYWWFAHVNPRLLRAEKPLPMREDTRAFLVQHLSTRNAGLSELLGRDLSDVWKDMTC